jgi:hypothetical protein
MTEPAVIAPEGELDLHELTGLRSRFSVFPSRDAALR